MNQERERAAAALTATQLAECAHEAKSALAESVRVLALRDELRRLARLEGRAIRRVLRRVARRNTRERPNSRHAPRGERCAHLSGRKANVDTARDRARRRSRRDGEDEHGRADAVGDLEGLQAVGGVHVLRAHVAVAALRGNGE